ncbi:MAG: hypothetical protein GY754_32845 [bacterium]|nr:hypothetical protein [bacterium]
MKKRIKIAKMLFYIIGGLSVIMAGRYLLTPGLLSYHITFLGMAQDELDPKVLTSMIYSLRIMGAMSLSIGIAVLVLARKMIPGENWGRWLLLIMLLISFTTVLVINLSVGPSTPWWLTAALIVMTIAGFFLSKK